MKKKIELFMVLFMLVGAIVVSWKLSVLTTDVVKNETWKVTDSKKVIVIDAGHGGEDPGKVGVNGVLEKDINLQIAKKVKTYLRENGVQVVMTRENDLTEESKRKDMEKRVALINKVKPVLAVSIHQNSFSDANVKGAQVFYYTESEEGKNAASLMQETLKTVDAENTRQMKGDNSFYLLKKTQVPLIIVECGFLSNLEEAEKLLTEEYQTQMAETIGEGILKWITRERAVLE